MRPLVFAALSVGLVSPLGCHSAFIDATISNRTDKPVSLVELDYPSASFGTQTLAPGQDFRYRFKVLGSGPLKLLYTDTANTEQHATGPSLHEGNEGTLTVTITPTGPQWAPHLLR
jgi:hypothetical protein